IIIFGEVGDPGVKASIAVDDVSFENNFCDELPQASGSFNCTFDTGFCGWQLGETTSPEFQSDLNQYTVKSKSPSTLRSPEIFQRKACFSFQYFVSSDSYRKDIRLLVFVRNASDSELLPFRIENVYYEQGRWHIINILLDHESAFDRVEIHHVECEVYFANFNIKSEIGNCNSNSDVKTFFVSSKKSSPKEYTVSKNGVNCDLNYPTSHFTARTIPSKDYPIPMYLFSSSYHTSLISNMDAVLDDLIGYFYVSKTSQANSSAIYYSIEDDKYGEYISEFSATPLAGNWTEYVDVVYVKRHQNHQDNGNCPPGYFDIMNKCLWLMCGGSYPTYAENRCSRTFGTLASLDETGMTRLAKYLDNIKARSVGITQITVGLSKKDRQWIWNDGRVYNNSERTLDIDSKNAYAYLTWEGNKFVLKDGNVPSQHHMCEKRGENLAYNSWPNQSSTSPEFSSELAVDGLYYTCSLTLQPTKRSQNSWWKIILDEPAKIYSVKIRLPIFAEKPLITVGLRDDGTLPNFAKDLEIDGTSENILICEPPLLARYVMIESKEGEYLQLCEVDVYAAGSLNDMLGVMRTFLYRRFYYMEYGYFDFAPSFSFSSSYGNDPEQELKAYVLAPYDGMYKFTLHGSVNAELLVTQQRDKKDILMTSSLERGKKFYASKGFFGLSFSTRYARKTKSSTIMLEACKFYFVKLTTTFTERSDTLKFTIERKNGSYWHTVEKTNLFWVLPVTVKVAKDTTRGLRV
ncbi:Hypothetical predicted protein, partial [Paramuricea clavata]